MRLPGLVACAVLLATPAVAAPAADAAPQPRDCSRLQTQADMNDCAAANFKAADAVLNRLYGKLMAAQRDAGGKARLRAAERAWVAYRDGECTFDVGPREEGGTIWPMMWFGCLREKTAARARELQHHLDCPAELACPVGKK